VNRLEWWLTDWANEILRHVHKSGFSGINIIEKILRDPGISTKGSRHRILWWPKTKRLYKVGKAMHQVDPIQRVCLIVQYGQPVNEDGTIFTKFDLAKNSSVTVREFNAHIKKSTQNLGRILLNS